MRQKQAPFIEIADASINLSTTAVKCSAGKSAAAQAFDLHQSCGFFAAMRCAGGAGNVFLEQEYLFIAQKYMREISHFLQYSCIQWRN
ncbi:MAG: hypothetical protein Q8Q81_09480 [Oxalobacteraceae bacterium]|nr:hypothetical protein [Oxalobacteraceae bacterium]